MTRMSTITTATAAIALAFAAGAGSATQTWTATKAATTIKAHYTTVDQKAYDFTKAKLDKLLADGTPETDPQVVALRAALKSQMHQAKPTKVSCRTAVAGKRFRCSVTVQGSARIPPDYELYTSVVKLTFVVKGRGYRITNGWR